MAINNADNENHCNADTFSRYKWHMCAHQPGILELSGFVGGAAAGEAFRNIL